MLILSEWNWIWTGLGGTRGGGMGEWERRGRRKNGVDASNWKLIFLSRSFQTPPNLNLPTHHALRQHHFLLLPCCARALDFNDGTLNLVLRFSFDASFKLTPFFVFSLVAMQETQTLSARNSVGLLAKTWWDLDMGVCDGVVEGGWDWSC